MLADVGPPPPHPSSCTYKNRTCETEMKDEVPEIREGCTGKRCLRAGMCILPCTYTNVCAGEHPGMGVGVIESIRLENTSKVI